MIFPGWEIDEKIRDRKEEKNMQKKKQKAIEKEKTYSQKKYIPLKFFS